MSVCVVLIWTQEQNKIVYRAEEEWNEQGTTSTTTTTEMKHRGMGFILARRCHFVLRTILEIVVEAPVHVHLVERRPQ